MAGDEVVAEWLGDVYGNRVVVDIQARRFSSSSLRFKNVYIINTHTSYDAYVGKYYSSVVTLKQNAAIIWSKSTLHFEYIDLYKLGYTSMSGTQYLQVIGINEY